MKQLNVGIVGTGMAFERLHLPAYNQLKEQYKITALCDVQEDRAKYWAQRLKITNDCVYTDYRELASRDDLDVIDVMVPIQENYTVTEDIAELVSGKPITILNEKPLAPTIGQAVKARELPKKYNVRMMIAENYRYNDDTNIIKNLISENRIGDVVYFIQNKVMCFPCDMTQNKFAATEWRQHPVFPGGALLDTAVHDLAGLRHIFGAVDKVQAFGRPQNDDFAPYAVINANIIFKSGVTGNFTFYSAGNEPQKPAVGLRIFGQNGMIYLENRDCATINIAYNDGNQEQIPFKPNQGYYNELLNLYNSITGQETVSVTPEMEFGDAKMVFDILESIRTNKVITVDSQAQYAVKEPEFTRV